MSAEKIIQSIKDHSITNSDEWFANLEDRKKEEVLLHDKLRDMNFRKKYQKKIPKNSIPIQRCSMALKTLKKVYF